MNLTSTRATVALRARPDLAEGVDDRAALDEHHRIVTVRLGFGRIVASEKEVPNMLAIPV